MSTVPPTARFDEKRFVELAVVAKKFVVVALVPVPFTKVIFCKVDEASERRPEVNVWVFDQVFVVVVPKASEIVLAEFCSG